LRISLSSPRTSLTTRQMREAPAALLPRNRDERGHRRTTRTRTDGHLRASDVRGDLYTDAVERIYSSAGALESVAVELTPTANSLQRPSSQDLYHDDNSENSTALLQSFNQLAWIPSLSVQQLVDCDTSFNRGCGGGSPLFAYHYITVHGLVPWSHYEYEQQVSCVAGGPRGVFLEVNML
jgi:hypothetical protein